MGKTSLATNITYNAAERWRRDGMTIRPKEHGRQGRFFSLEMSADQLATRVPNSRGCRARRAWARSAKSSSSS